ncbi:MAG: FAD-dependent oxidoreductase [Fuerstiella sp.]
MSKHVQNLIIGQGLGGSAVAWTLSWSGQSLFVIDRGDADSASRVAAGLITPVTGKRLVQSPEFQQDWTAARNFYRRVEQQTNTHLFDEHEMIRLFSGEAARTEFLQRSDSQSDVQPWQGPLQQDGVQHIGIRMQPAARLNVAAYLSTTRDFLQQQNSYLKGAWNYRAADVSEHGVTVPEFDLSADRIILCQGSEPSQLFPEVPNNPCRGDILTVRIDGYQRTEVVHRSIWIAPEDDGRQTVGSTYDWKFSDSEPTADGRREIEEKLRRLQIEDFTVDDQRSAVRPTMKDYHAVIGRHPQQSRIFVLNGLGSKGTLKAPKLARDLVELINGVGDLDPTVSYQRLRHHQTAAGRQKPLTQLAQDFVAETLRPGDIAVDATVGNGFDTCFLAGIVGASGIVHGFDVQAAAIQATRKRLESAGLTNIRLWQQSHEQLGSVVDRGHVAAVMFNLGYLPRGDHTIITTAESSITAIEAAVDILKDGGILTVLCYRGHDGGAQEYEAVRRLMTEYAERNDLTRIDSQPAKQTSPVLFVLRKQIAAN